MRIALLICRYLLGLLFIVFGANKWLHFAAVPMPAGDAGIYYGLLFQHHVMAVVAVFEVAGGFLLLSGRQVALGLCLLAPVVVNILLYHLLFGSSRIGLALVVTCLETILIFAYRRAFAGLLQSKVELAR